MGKIVNRETERQKMFMDFIDNRVDRLLVEIEDLRKSQEEYVAEISEQIKIEEIRFEKHMKKWIERQHRFKFQDNDIAGSIGREWNMNPVEENMEKALQYFDIPKSETKEGFYLASNNKNMRDVTGISAVEESCKEGGRFRITTYYDPEFPSIVTCVTKCQ